VDGGNDDHNHDHDDDDDDNVHHDGKRVAQEASSSDRTSTDTTDTTDVTYTTDVTDTNTTDTDSPRTRREELSGVPLAVCIFLVLRLFRHIHRRHIHRLSLFSIGVIRHDRSPQSDRRLSGRIDCGHQAADPLLLLLL
jgi:hypothetical protein